MTPRLVMRSSLVALAVIALPARADPLDEVQALPCRPTIACTAEIVPGGALEIETGYAQRRAGAPAANSVLALLKYSATDWLQLQLGSNNVMMSSGGASQWMDGVYLGPKVVVFEQTDSRPTLAISALFALPTRSGSDAIAQTVDGDFWIYLSKDLLGFHADLNLGADVLSITDKPATQLLAALSVSHDVAYGLGAMLETYAFEGGGSYAAHDAGVLMGLSYAPTPRVTFDLGGDIALHRDTRSVTLFAGITLVPYHGRRAAPSAGRELASAVH